MRFLTSSYNLEEIDDERLGLIDLTLITVSTTVSGVTVAHNLSQLSIDISDHLQYPSDGKFLIKIDTWSTRSTWPIVRTVGNFWSNHSRITTILLLEMKMIGMAHESWDNCLSQVWLWSVLSQRKNSTVWMGSTINGEREVIHNFEISSSFEWTPATSLISTAPATVFASLRWLRYISFEVEMNEQWWKEIEKREQTEYLEWTIHYEPWEQKWREKQNKK